MEAKIHPRNRSTGGSIRLRLLKMRDQLVVSSNASTYVKRNALNKGAALNSQLKNTHVLKAPQTSLISVTIQSKCINKCFRHKA